MAGTDNNKEYFPQKRRAKLPNVITNGQFVADGNFVHPTAKNCIVTGVNNFVGAGCENITILGSSGCVVYPSLRDVNILNSSGTIVSSNNSFYVNNSSVGSVLNSVSGTVGYMPVYYPDGNTLGNSPAYSDGTFVGLGTTTPQSKLNINDNSGLRIDSTDIGYGYLKIVPYSSTKSYANFVFQDSEEIRVGGAFSADAGKFRLISPSGAARLGINKNSPAATIDIMGEGNSNTSYSIKVYDIDGALIFSLNDDGDLVANSFSVGGSAGATGTFISADAKTVTVTKGIITSIV